MLDQTLAEIWQRAKDQKLGQIETTLNIKAYGTPLAMRAALACLAEAGVLERVSQGEIHSEGAAKPALERGNTLLSAIVVSYNSRTWLERCLPSLLAQSYQPIEVIVVDNASQDASAQWITQTYPDLTLIELEKQSSLAQALNRGIEAARGEFFLLINPDTELAPQAVAQMLAVAGQEPSCAAVAAKLKFTWAPAFLNGLGNYVGAFSWGTDSALGHLDLGQFDDWNEIPSACFAAALVPAAAWEDIGPIDEGFPLYYEDSEWCYRARLYGYSIHAAPRAVVYHAFSGRVPTGEDSALSEDKLRQVVYGRLRFATKILGRSFLIRFLLNYFIEDAARFGIALIRGRWNLLKAYFRAWNDYRMSLEVLKVEREHIQQRRKLSDKELFRLQRKVPAPMIRNGLPQLTWDIVCNQYFPLIASGQTREFAEFSGFLPDQPRAAGDLYPQPLWRRATQIWRNEGLSALLHRIGKTIQWRLVQP